MTAQVHLQDMPENTCVVYIHASAQLNHMETQDAKLADLSSHLFSPRLLVIHDSYTGCQNDLPKLQTDTTIIKRLETCLWFWHPFLTQLTCCMGTMYM